MQRSKAYTAGAEKIDRDTLYSPLEAVRLAKATNPAKFDATVEVAFRLGVDPRKADQMVRGTVNLPHGTGKTARVLVFANGEKAQEALAAGADEVGGDELIDKVAAGYTDFDAAVATPDLMGKVGRLGKVLGPRGLMPNPKTGTVTEDTAMAVKQFAAGRVEYRMDKNGNLQVPFGKLSFSVEQLLQNCQAVIDAVSHAKPAAAKGTFIRRCTLSSTMGPGLRVNVRDKVAEAA